MNIDRSQLEKLRQDVRDADALAKAEEARLREAHRKSKIFSREFSWLKIRTTWENTRPNANPIRYTVDGTYGLKNALSAAAHDLAWPRQDPHSKALKVEIFYDDTGNGSVWKEEDRAKMTLVATIEPPKETA